MRSAAQVQKDINKALKESGGAWTSQLNALVSERSAAREAEKGGSVPRETEIMGQRHMLAYINEDERRLLKDLGGADIPGPAGIPSFPPTGAQMKDIEKQRAENAAQRDDRAPAGTYSGTGTKTVSTPAGTKTVSTAPAPSKTVEVKSTSELREEKAAKDAAAAAAAQIRVAEILGRDTGAASSSRDDRAPAGTYVPSAPAAPPPAQVTREPEPYSPPVIDLGVINIAPEPDYSYDPYAESLQSWFNEMSPAPSAPVVDPVAEARARELAARAAAEDAARTKATLEALDALRRTTGVQPGLTSAAIDPFAATPLGQIGNIMNVGYGAGQIDPRLAAAANRSKISEEEFQRAVANYQPDKGLGVLATAGVPLTLELLGTAAQGLGSIVTEPLAGVGYGAGQVDPRLAAAVAGGAPGEISYVPSNLTNPLIDFGSQMAEAGDVLVNRALGNAPRLARENLAADIWTTDEQGNTVYNNDALVAKIMFSLAPTTAGLAGGVAGLPGYVATASLLGAGEVALQSKDQVEAYARSKGIDPAMAKAMGDEAVRLGTMYGLPMEAVSNALFSPFASGNLFGNAAKNAVEEFFTEGALEQTLSNVAALQATGQNVLEQPYYGGAFDLDEATVAAALGSGISLLGGGTQTAPAVPPVAPSVLQPLPPFIPAAPTPGFTPGAGPAATMTVEGTATDVTPGFTPTGPNVGQIAQTPTGILTAYQQAADTLGEAGIRNIGGTPATMMDVAAATEIINNEIAETGGLSPETALNLERATGLSATAIKDIAETAPRVGTARDTLITDVVTGTGGGGQIQVTANPNGTYTLRNLTTGNPQHVATVEPGQSLDEAIKIFDEVTTVGSPEAIRVDTAGVAIPPPRPTPAAEPVPTPAAEPTTALVPTGPTGIATLPSVGAGTQLDTAQPVDLTADTATTAEVLEFTPAEDVIEGTAVEIAGQIPGTVATTTTPAIATEVTVPAVSTAVSTVAEDIEEPPEEPAAPEAEEEAPGAGGEEPGAEITIEEAVEEEEEEEPPFECPEGYTAVKLGGRWVCQKTETSTVGRPTIGTRPYLSRVGFAGPSPYPPSTRTVTRTVTAAE